MAKPLHLMLASMIDELIEAGFFIKTAGEGYSNGLISQIQHDHASFYTKGSGIVVDPKIYEGLDNPAILFLVNIQKEIVPNNPLWHLPVKARNSSVRSILAELKRREILFTISGTDMFVINPIKMRKGKPLSIYGSLFAYSKAKYEKNKRWKATSDDIKRLPVKPMIYIPEARDEETDVETTL